MATATKSLSARGRGRSLGLKSSGDTQLSQTVGTESAHAVRGKVFKCAITTVPVLTVNG